ncbi:hypothetical protein BU23DRAFT_562787 [Bimuria novae-zelandiae CBS 107.79]|uniref:Uncharacterized protein n=1 Tax=Bimuria novae-zelandiae CBS 107.79 TaxID=1447943 RepID=A0A6A5VRW1_9PLEO|nr:hypothetical protein BU23DRAFT_562787 [Bimuria novae-zelandiae CBS 107.79]
MSPILSTLVFTAAATAQLTTSIWMPSPYQDDINIGFLASVVGVNEGKTTLALHFDDQTDLKTAGYIIDHKPNTMTFEKGGFEAVSTESAQDDVPASTVTYGCQLNSPKSASAGGVCSFVSDGSALSDSAGGHTYSIEEEDIATYQVVITAGTEKLRATAGATPSSSGPAPTATLAFSLHRGQNVVPTATAPPDAPAQATGAAGVVLPLHPAVAGLGAAAMAFLL